MLSWNHFCIHSVAATVAMSRYHTSLGGHLIIVLVSANVVYLSLCLYGHEALASEATGCQVTAYCVSKAALL